NSVQYEIFFGLTIRGNDEPDRFSGHLGTGVTEHLLRAGVPRRDDTVKGRADNRVVRGGNDRGEEEFKALSIADVMRNFGRTDNYSLSVPYGRDRKRDMDSRAVFSLTYGFKMIYSLPLPNLAQNIVFFRLSVRGNYLPDRLSNRFGGRIAEHLFGGGVPR